MKTTAIFILILLLQGCSSNPKSNPKKAYYFSENVFTSGNLSIPNDNKDDEIDDNTLEFLDSRFKKKRWGALSTYAFETLNPQDLTYYYLGVSAENKGFYKGALKYYNKAITHNKKGLTCIGVLYNDCNDFDFPSEIYKAIDRVNTKIKQFQYSNRARNVTINIDQPYSFFFVGGNRYKSGESVKLIPGKYSVLYYTDTVFSEGEITLTTKDSDSKSVALSLKNSPKNSLTIVDINKAIKITNETIKDLRSKSDTNTDISQLSGMVDWKMGVDKQYKSIHSSLLKLDQNTSLYSSTLRYRLLLKDLNKLLTEKIINTYTKDFSEYLVLAHKINNLGIEPYKVPIFNNARLEGSDLYSSTDIDNLNCKSYILATKNPKLTVHIKNSEKSEYSSQYIQEYRDIPNDRYSQLKSELREARYALEDYRYEQSTSSSNYGGSGSLAFLSGVLGGLREDQLEEDVATLQSELRNTPRTIREEIKGEYYPVKNNVTFVKDNSVEWMSINCNTGRVNTYKLIKEEAKNFTLYEGVRSDDLNQLPSSNKSTKALMKQWSNSAFISLGNIEVENDNYLLSTSTIDTDDKSIRRKIEEFFISKN